jgi:NAD(P)-dependent dehydrogenase (short-subunit alcohol dehydrogenase family)
MSTYFADKICVVTGAGSGIGRATALELAGNGVGHLVMADINRENLEATQKLVTEAGAAASIVQLDVSNREAIYDLAEQTLATHGQVDFVLNNAGIANIAPVESLAIEDFERVMNVDFWGVVHGTQAFLPSMIQRDFGHIANISSIFGFIGVPNQGAYNSAKFAVHGFTEALRQEMYGTGVKISCVHPGGIDTQIARNAILPQGEDSDERREEIATNFKTMVKSTPLQAAQTILRGVEKGKARILIGRDAHMVDIIRRIFPTRYGDILGFRNVADV